MFAATTYTPISIISLSQLDTHELVYDIFVTPDPLQVPDQFTCELCRLRWADPFWQRTDLLFFSKLRSTAPNAPPGAATDLFLSREVPLSKAQLDRLRTKPAAGAPELQLQLCCVCLQDQVSNRMQWPKHLDLEVNGTRFK